MRKNKKMQMFILARLSMGEERKDFLHELLFFLVGSAHDRANIGNGGVPPLKKKNKIEKVPRDARSV